MRQNTQDTTADTFFISSQTRALRRDTTCRNRFLDCPASQTPEVIHAMPRRTRPADRPPPAKAATASIPSAATFRAEKLARRISHILALLHQGDVLDKQQLAQQFEVDVRTIERDLHERLADIIERNAEGKWQIKAELRSTIPANYLHEYSRLAGTARLFPDTSLPWLLKQLQTASAATRGLHVQAAPEEDLRGQSATFH